MRGEYPTRGTCSQVPMELPPHARRIPRELHEPVATHGTTSACAENTHRQSSNRRKSGTTSACAENTCRWHPSSLGCWNYLRMRGEYRKDGRIENLWPELPPHARRIRGVNPARRIIRGTTSACAENTAGITRTCGHSWNYLRMRGEYPPAKL